MENNAWLLLITAGLILDIIGVWLLARPLLNIIYGNKESFKKCVNKRKVKIALIIITAGFVLQIIGNWIKF